MQRIFLFLMLLVTRTTLVCAVLGGILATWGYYGYQRISCHPMFQTGNVVCDEVSVLAAEHSLILARMALPYQAFILDHRSELTTFAVVVVSFALLVEIGVIIVKIIGKK